MSWGKPSQADGLEDACDIYPGAAPRLVGQLEGLPSPHTLCRSFATPPHISHLMGLPGCQDQLPGLATCGPQPSAFTASVGEPADPLSLADDDFTSFAINLAWGHEDMGQAQAGTPSRAWHRLGADSSSEPRPPVSPFLGPKGACLPTSAFAAQNQHGPGSRLLIDNFAYVPFPSPDASIVSTSEGEMRRASTLTKQSSGALLKRHSAESGLEEACKRVRSNPDLSHSSSMSDTLTCEEFSHTGRAVPGAALTLTHADVMASPAMMPTYGHVGPDAGSAANTPTVESTWAATAASGSGSAKQMGKPSPLPTLKPFNIVKGSDAMTVAQLNSRIKGATAGGTAEAAQLSSPTSTVASGRSDGSPVILPLSQGAPSEQNVASSSRPGRNISPAIKLQGNCIFSNKRITIKPGSHRAWQR